MRKIWKFSLPMDGIVEMPVGATILSVAIQRDVPCVWALCDPEAPKEQRHLKILGTGWRLEGPLDPESMRFIGTFLIAGDSLVFHVFDDRP